MDLGSGVVTPGYVDLRPVVDALPWPDVRGKRCLDVGTFDGFYAFEMERRGAAEVVVVDIDDYRQLDWPARIRVKAPEELQKMVGEERGRGFKIAAKALDSRAKRESVSVYDLDPGRIGTFDVIVLGSLVTHQRRDRARQPCHAPA